MAHVESYRLQDGSKRYRVRWTPVGGSSRSRTFVLKKDADRFALEQQRRASLGALYQAPPETLGEFLVGWLDRYALRVRPSTRDRTRDLTQHLDPFRRVPLDEIRPAAVEDHIAELAKRAPRQAELTLRLLKQVLANAKERGHLVDEAVFRVRAPRREPREVRFIGWEEVEELAANTTAPYGNMVMLAALTGLRQGELFALRDRNLDLEAKTVTVETGTYKGELVPVKTRASRRRVDLSTTALRVLRRQLLAREPNELGLVFPSPEGAILNDDNFRHRVFAPAVRRTKLTGFRFPRSAPHLRGAHGRRRRPPEVPPGADGPLLDPRHARPRRAPLPGRESGRPGRARQARRPIHAPWKIATSPEEQTKSPRKRGLSERERRDSNPRPPA